MNQTLKRHIALCGFMACGKTTLGRALGTLLNFPFTDLDQHIEKVNGNSIGEIFTEHGEKHFRGIERLALQSVLKAKQRVIALGGGTICDKENMDLTRSSALLVFIEVPREELFNRLKSDTTRPLIKGADEKTLRKYIDDTLTQRIKYYRQAHLAVSGMGLDAWKLKEIIETYEADTH